MIFLSKILFYLRVQAKLLFWRSVQVWDVQFHFELLF
jgi:hypothetical protein